MPINAPAYRITPDDLSDGDKKFKRAIEPLLDALNRTLGAVVKDLTSRVEENVLETSFTTPTSGVASVTITVGAPCTELWCTYMQPSPQVAYGVSWDPTAKGATVYFPGLPVSTKYNIRLRYL